MGRRRVVNKPGSVPRNRLLAPVVQKGLSAAAASAWIHCPTN